MPSERVILGRVRLARSARAVGLAILSFVYNLGSKIGSDGGNVREGSE